MTKGKVFSYRKGYSFSFEDEGYEIIAWFSALSGLEKIYVNGELVASQRNLSTNSSNTFRVGGNEYSTNMKAVSLLKGPFVCTLIKNGKEFKRKKILFPKPINKSNKATVNYIIRFFIFILIAVFFGFIKTYYNFPQESKYIFWALFVPIIFYIEYINARKKYGEPEIISETIV